jgi:hypothetical protein
MTDTSTQLQFESGDIVMYTSNSGDIEVATVVRTHFDDDPPYYTIRLDRSNKEKQTDARNLTPLFEDEVYDADKGSEEISDDTVTGKSERKRCPLTTMRPVFTAVYSLLFTSFPRASELVFFLGVSHYFVPAMFDSLLVARRKRLCRD